jgi:hypothetical protein
MALQQPITDYTNRDYNSLLTSLLDLAAQKLPEWTDRSENDLGRLLLELFAYTGDVLLYYQDRIANEAFLSTAVERRSVIDLLALIGYTLATPAPAAVDLQLTVPNNSTDAIIIQVGAQFATKASPGRPSQEFIYLPIDNQPLEIRRDGTGGELIYPPSKGDGQDYRKLTVINATRIPNEELGLSTGEANQSFRLKQNPILLPRTPNISNYLIIEVGSNGSFTRWERQETLLYSYSPDPHYIVRINDRDEAEIFFGDGQYGQIPPFGKTIRASYLIGGGSAGNVSANQQWEVKSGISLSISQGKINNNNAASGGEDQESIENARRNAPRVYRSLQRVVTEADYVALAESFPGVVKAAAIAPSWNYVDLYIVANDFDLTDDLRAKLLQYFEDKRMVTTLVNVRSPVFVNIDIQIDIGIEATSYRLDVMQRVRAAIAALFQLDRLNFGQWFYLSKIYEAVEAVAGVAYADIIHFQSTPPDPSGSNLLSQISLADREFPRPGEIVVNRKEGGL